MSKFTFLFILFLCGGWLSNAAAINPPLFSGGDGSSGNPYKISCLDDLKYLSENNAYWDCYFIQTADIDASDTKNWNSGDGFSPIGNGTSAFKGTYNGDGHTINGLFINRSSMDYIGLFGSVLSTPPQNAKIKKLGIVDCNIKGNKYVGGLVGSFYGDSISYFYSSGNVSSNSNNGNNTGGLVGGTENTLCPTAMPDDLKLSGLHLKMTS